MSLALLGLMVAILGIGCITAGFILEAAVAQQQRTNSIKLVLGATRGRLFKDETLSNSVLVCLACVLGLALSALVDERWFAGSAYKTRTAWERLGPGITEPSFWMVVAGMGMMLCATTLVPAFRAVGAADSIGSAHSSGRGRRRRRFSHLLVSMEVAISVAAVISALLVMKALLNELAIPLRFDARDRLELNLRITGPLSALMGESIDQKLARIPGVVGTAMARFVPPQDVQQHVVLRSAGGGRVPVAINEVGPQFFAVLGIPVIRGREFEWPDIRQGEPVAVVNERLAAQLGSDRSSIGSRVSILGKSFRVIGVVANARVFRLRETAGPMVYVPLRFDEAGSVKYVIRHAHELAPTPAVLESALSAGNVRLLSVRSLQDKLEPLTRRSRWLTSVLSVSALHTGILLAGGVFALTLTASLQRRREWAVKAALGAPAGKLARSVLFGTALPAVVGTMLGVVLALYSQRLLSAASFGVDLSDTAALSIVGIALVVSIVALAAGPAAAHAARASPAALLRE